MMKSGRSVERSSTALVQSYRCLHVALLPCEYYVVFAFDKIMGDKECG